MISKKQHTEIRAIQTVKRYLRKRGYSVSEVKKEGYDLYAHRRGRQLRVEVKGRSGEKTRFDMNYRNIAALRKKAAIGDYWLCVVQCGSSSKHSRRVWIPKKELLSRVKNPRPVCQCSVSAKKGDFDRKGPS